MNQAIKIIDEIISELIIKRSNEKKYVKSRIETAIHYISQVRDKISSLPSDTQWIDRLNNLKNRTDRDYEFVGESQRSYDKGQIDILEEILS